MGSRTYMFGETNISASFAYGQRHITITKNAIGPKSGQKDCRKF